MQVAEWFGEHLFTGEVAGLLAKVVGLDIEEREKRVMVQLTSSEEVDQLLARMGEEGVEWPEFVDPSTNMPIRIKGFSTDKSSLRVTLLDVPRDVEEETIKTAMSDYGNVQEVKRHHLHRPGMEHIKVNRVSVKMERNREVELPTTIFGLGSTTSGGERSIWRVTYPGAPRSCYRCGNPNHMARDCRRQPLTMKQVERMSALGEAPLEGEDELEHRVAPLSFAAVVKSAKFLEDVAREKREAEQLKTARQEKKQAEDSRREAEVKVRDDIRKAKMEEKKQEEEARQASHLAELGKKLEKAALHKKYVKNLHDQAQAEVREAAQYQKGMENMILRGVEDEEEQEGGKRQATSPALLPPLAKKPPATIKDGAT